MCIRDRFKYRTITGVKGVSVKPEHLILDGQQRLTSIYQATSSKEPVSYTHLITENKKEYLNLLLLADEQESMIDRYLDRGRM